jgi:serine 3-dehydrogenase
MKTVFITGATAGHRRRLRAPLRRGGWRVVGTGRRRERLDELAQGARRGVPPA